MDGTGVRGGRRRRAASAALVATVVLVGGLALAGCSSSGTTGDASALPPVIVDLGDVDGTTVEVTEGGTIDLTGDDDTYAAWTADIDDPDVVEFVAGRDDGSAQFNPGLTAKSVGETDVTLDNGETGDTVTFTVDVVPKAAGGY